jgi:hypothetical protein
LSRGPIIDPNHVPFAYVTEAVGYTVRDGGLVEVAFTAEHVTGSEADAPPARVIQARLAMPIATAASVADVLGRITDPASDDPDGGPPAVDAAAVSHGIIVAGLDFVVRELLDHQVTGGDREALLDWLRDRLQSELRKADIAGVAAAEGPAVDHALGVLGEMFERWHLLAEAGAAPP